MREKLIHRRCRDPWVIPASGVQRGRGKADSARRGLSAISVILSMSLIFALLALAVDVGLLVQRHQQLKSAGEAAALATAIRLFEAPPGEVTTVGHLQARNAGVAFAAENSFSVHRLELNANLANQPKGDIVLGAVDPLELGGLFVADRSQDDRWHPVSYESTPFDASRDTSDPVMRLNAVLVRTRHSQAGGGGPLLFFGQLVGVPSHDIFTESIAAVERRVCGYRPVGCTPVPMLPILCRTQRWTPADWKNNDGDQHDHHAPFLPDPAAQPAEDAVASARQVELKIRLRQHSDDKENEGETPKFKRGQPIPSRFLSFIDEDSAIIVDQIYNGLSAADLIDCGGELRLGDLVPCLEVASSKSERLDGEKLQQALQSIVGQLRILPLGCGLKRGGGRGGHIEDFAACVIVHSQLDDDAITILVQPVVLNSCTAIVDPQANFNPWVGKVFLVR